MKEKLKSLRIRMLLPVIVMAVFVVTMLTTLFSRAYISMIVQQPVSKLYRGLSLS